jgi:hypothetical protein
MGTSALPGIPPPTPEAIAEYRQQRVRGAPSQFPSGQSQSQWLTGPLPWPHFHSGEPGTRGGGDENRPGRQSRSRSFHGLTTQKRGSTDETMRAHRESWREMEATPPSGIWGMWGKWWNGYVYVGSSLPILIGM